MSGIFVSYRREDAGGWARSIHDRLVQTFGSDQVFMDVEDIPAAVDFADFITQRLRGVDALVAVIGNEWATLAGDDGRPRIQDPDDLLRREIAIALWIGVQVIPVLVDGASMPRVSELPADLQRLTRLHAVELRPSSFSTDSDRLVEALGAVSTREALESQRIVPRRGRKLAWLAGIGAAIVTAGVILTVYVVRNDRAPDQVTTTVLVAPPETTSTTATTTTTTTVTTPPEVSELNLSLASAVASYERPLVNGLLCTGETALYTADMLIDGDMNTGWGADSKHIAGDGTEQSITIDLGRAVALARVGLTPGYAKIGPRQDNECQDTEAFPHNRFVRQVEYQFDDGSRLTQQFEQRKDLQIIDLTQAIGRPVTTRNVTIVLVDVVSPPGVDADTILSEARFWYLPDQG